MTVTMNEASAQFPTDVLTNSAKASDLSALSNCSGPKKGTPVKSTDFGGSLPIFLPSYRQPTDLPQSTDFYRFFRGSTEF